MWRGKICSSILLQHLETFQWKNYSRNYKLLSAKIAYALVTLAGKIALEYVVHIIFHHWELAGTKILHVFGF